MEKIKRALLIVPNNSEKDFILTFSEYEEKSYELKLRYYISKHYSINAYKLIDDVLVRVDY